MFQKIKNNIVFFLQHQQNLAKWNFVCLKWMTVTFKDFKNYII